MEIQQKANISNESTNISLDNSDNNNLADFNAISNEDDVEDEKSNITLIVEEGDSNIQEEEQAPSQVVAADITSRLKMLSVQSNDENGITVEDVSDEEEEEA